MALANDDGTTIGIVLRLLGYVGALVRSAVSAKPAIFDLRRTLIATSFPTVLGRSSLEMPHSLLFAINGTEKI